MVNLTDKKEVNNLNKQLETQVSEFIKEMSSPFVNSLNDIDLLAVSSRKSLPYLAPCMR